MRRFSVLVTRPAMVMGALGTELTDLGYDVFCEPFLSIEKLTQTPPLVEGPFITILTSQIAAHFLRDQQLYGWPELYFNDCYCIGHKTAQEARQAGFLNVCVGTGDGEGLAQTIAQTEPTLKQAIHISGQDTDRTMMEILAASGRPTISWPIYRAIKKQKISLELQDRLRSQTLDAAVFMSVRTAQAFCAALHDVRMEQFCRTMTAVALSPRIADLLSDLPWKKLAVAKQPDQTAIVEIMKDIYAPSQG